MRILVLTFYYPPDLSAGSFRMRSFVPALAAQLPDHARVDVLTTHPNRYASFRSESSAKEQHGKVHIERVRLPPHRSGMVDQSRSFLTYARWALSRVQKQRYDLVFATSSRLMTAVIASRIARTQGLPLYLDLRDLFAENMRELLHPVAATLTAPIFNRLEAYAVRRAERINLVSRGFEPYIHKRHPGTLLDVIPNGIDPEFLTVDWDKQPSVGAHSPLRITYAGNIGEGQGLEHIVPELASKLGTSVSFRIIGDGGRLEDLKTAIDREGVSNVSVEPPVNRTQLIQAYQESDVLFLHLNDHKAFRRVLPSKLFEYGATGRPILAGIAGFSAEFVRTELPNAQVFSPRSVDGAVHAISLLRLGQTDRSEFVNKYTRTSTAADLARRVSTLLTHARHA